MPNINFSIKERGGQGGRTAIIGIRAIRDDVNLEVQRILKEAAEEGKRIAEIEAPRSKDARNEGRRITDAIRVSERRYQPGGPGGGGTYLMELIADGEIAPHLIDVFEGTANKGEGYISPARGNLLTFQKHGEGRKWRPWVKGQKPQQEWWNRAQQAVEDRIQERVHTSGIGVAIRR